jgi:lipid II:glycine glycyltransferase (peptidoglycan interpeptide bridge formation enzyme)
VVTTAVAAVANSQDLARHDVADLRADPRAWDAFVAANPHGGFLQLSAWAEANASRGWRSERLVCPTPSGPVGAQVLLHRMQPGPWSRAYAPRGPIATSLDERTVATITDALRELAARERLSHVLVDPEVDRGTGLERLLVDAGWREAGEIQINRTRLIDLDRPESELWGDLRSSARWSVNRARRSGISVAEAGREGLGEFERLYLETARRVGFEPAAYRAVVEAFASREAARIMLARGSAGDPLAALVLIDCGTRVIEYYGASSAAGATARANYLVKWEAIRASRERGMAVYDMWGTDVPGLAEFKAAFGGRERTYVGAWELVTNRAGYLSVRGLQLARRAFDRARAAV